MANFTFDHIHLRSPDIEATAAWFEEKLGAKVSRVMAQGRPRMVLTLGGTTILINQADANTAAPPSAPNQGVDHFGLAVQGLDEAVAELKAKGVPFTMEITEARPGVRICFIRGPENISIELLERQPGA
ncbi:VOC family protein [Roseococcus sp. YIM B11640]|uniref:VOC family protein n=1 Tax=Roseococcus sp. YIM B11640 TaxID=3133973 RepID=UPI003C799D65